MGSPSISPLSDSIRGADGVGVPPLHFKPLVGELKKVNIGAQRAQVQIHAAMSAAKIAGIRYEWQVQEQLSEWFKPCHIQHCIHFEDESGWRTVIPDVLLICSDYIVLVEIKSQHMPEAWWQCEKLYKPLLMELFGKPVFCVEIVKTFDPQMKFPTSFELIGDLEAWVKEPKSEWGVFKWRKTK